MLSAIISIAPAIASSTFATSFSSDTYSLASVSRGSLHCCNKIIFASGSRPFSLAIVALVLLLGRYGLYKSSTTTRVSAATIILRSSSVSFPCSSILESTCSFFSSRLRKYINLSCNLRNCSSSRDPVTSLRYLEINGIVFPSSINLTAASTCHFCTANSSVIFWLISIILTFPSQT